jgi:hypothetical protein
MPRAWIGLLPVWLKIPTAPIRIVSTQKGLSPGYNERILVINSLSCVVSKFYFSSILSESDSFPLMGDEFPLLPSSIIPTKLPSIA